MLTTVSTMINFQSILTTAIQKVPYNWALIENMLSPEACLELSASFPQEEFWLSQGEGYKYFWGKMLARESDIPIMLKSSDDRWRQRVAEGRMTSELGHLSQIWQQLIKEIWTDAYRTAMSKISGLDLKDCLMDVGFRRYATGHGHYPHTDEPQKVLTHLLFFNRQWSKDWGGYLRILNNAHPESTFQDILPLSHSSVVIMRSDRSWHTVTPVTCPVTECRLAVRVAFFQKVI